MSALAFDTALNPFGAELNAMLSSDLSHWDVPDMLAILREAHELVDDRLMSPAQFRAFSADNCIRLHGQMNPRFFDGTVVEAHAATVLGHAPGTRLVEQT